MANPQPTDAHLRIAHRISEEIMASDFSKRQRKILDLILRLSWGCNKKWAYIPRQRDFQLVGVPETVVKGDLHWLQEARVIFIDEKNYSFNKDYDQWRVSRAKAFTHQKLNDLISLNLQGSAEKLNESSSFEGVMHNQLQPPVVHKTTDNSAIHENDTSCFVKSLHVLLSCPATTLASLKEIIKRKEYQETVIHGGEICGVAVLWQRALRNLRNGITSGVFSSYLDNSLGLAVGDGVFVIGVKTEYIAESIASRLKNHIEKALLDVSGQKYELVCAIANDDPVSLQVRETIDIVCDELSVDKLEVMTGVRTATVVEARRAIARRLSETTGLSILKIGRHLGLKDARMGKGAFDF